MTEYTKFIIERFYAAADPGKAVPMENYMKNNFKFLGITSQRRDEIFAEARKKFKLPRFVDSQQDIIELWNMNEREFHYAAGDMLIRNKKEIPESYIPVFEWLITTNSWWDSVDTVVPKPVGEVLSKSKNLARETSLLWAKNDNKWLKRAALLFQLKHKQNLDTKLLEEIIMIVKPTKEFFVQKAIGWILREYSKTNPDWVREYINSTELSNLARKEGLKIISKIQ